MKTIRKLKASKRRSLSMLFCVLLCLSSGIVRAANQTFTVKADNGNYGEVRYMIGDGSWSVWAANHSVTAADGATVTVEARVKTGNTAYGFSRWYVNVENKPQYYSASKSFSFTVTSAYAGKVAQANFNAWTEDLKAGATYTLTSTTGNLFTVTCSNTSSPCHNKTYSYIGNVTVKSGTVKIVYNTTNYLLVTGTIRVQKGNLEMGFGNGATFAADRPTIKRAWGNTENLVLVRPATREPGDPANVYTDYALTISGKASDDMSKNFVICGQYATARMDSTLLAGSDGIYTDYHLVKGDDDMLIERGGKALVYLDGGIVDFDYVTVEKDWNTRDPSGIFFGGNGKVEGDKIKLEAELDHCLMQWLYGYMYGGACKVDNYVRGSWVRMTDCEVRYSESGNNGDPTVTTGGAVRSSGNNLCSLTMTRCDIHHNCTPDRGGGIRWNATLIDPSLIIQNCTIRQNWAGNYGGGMRVEGQADVIGCSFIGNRAEKCGGGLSLGTFTIGGPEHLYVGGGVWFPRDCSIVLDSESRIENNSAAEYGGGVYINVELATLEGGACFNCGGQEFEPWTVYLNDQYEQFKGKFEMNGAIIKNNTAGIDGGAVYMSRTTDYYGLITDLNSGTIDNNMAKGNGGAFCLTEDIAVPVNPNPTIYEYNGTTYNLVPQNIHANLGTQNTSVTEDLTMSNNKAVNGGGIYVNNGSVTVYGNAVVGSENNSNICYGGDGGAVYVTGGNLTMNGGSFAYNQAKKSGDEGGNGAGFYVSGGQVEVKGGTISNNVAEANGGGFYVDVADASIVTKINSSVATTTISHNKATNGGGAYINKGQLKIEDAATSIVSDTATISGGGIYMASGTVTYTDATMEGNKAMGNDGGGLYLGSGTITVSGTTAAIRGNEAKVRGGGIYVGGGTFNMTGGAIGGTTAQGNKTGADGYGGGLYVNNGTATVSGGGISGNEAVNGYGGGIYMNGGSCTLSGGATVGGATTDHANKARHGGGIYSAGGAITVNGGDIARNTATEDGGGIYSNGPTATVTITKEGATPSLLEYNQAVRGGGIFANRGVVDFTDGNVRHNTASEAGGGMYVNTEGTLNLKGNATLSGNHVPATGKGGGVYLAGTVVVGESAKALGTITAQDNYAGASYQYDPTHGLNNRNNIYLPEPVANPYTSSEHRDVITVIENGVGTTSRVGFSVPRNHVPVIYCAYSLTSRAYLKRFKTGPDYDLNMVLFDDTERYLSVHEASNPYFDPDHVYLYGFWPEAVIAEPSAGFTWSGDTLTISTEEGLAWLINYVNGWKGSAGVPHTLEGKVVSLASDLNMEAFGWAPVGFKGREGVPEALFKGEFDGNGHTIEGVNGMVYGNDDEGVYAYGLFGKVEDANIHDVFVKGTKYYLDDNPGLVLGGLVGESVGVTTISNSESQSTLVSQSPAAVIGGLVGKLNGGEVHSCIGIADMRGGTMGGLVGEQSAGAILRNSFANARFERHPDATTQYMGGLVAVNRGLVENCYARLRNVPDGNFGRLVGDNEGGTVRYSYAPQPTSQYTVTGKEGTLEGVGTYGETRLPYLYKHRDTQVAATNNEYVPTGDEADKQMMKVLNAWVEKRNVDLGEARYTSWGRPWQKGDEAKPINEDYPVLEMPLSTAVASRAGDSYLHYAPLDTLLTSRTKSFTESGDAIWLYRSEPNTVTGSTGSGELYIAEDAMLVHTGTLDAYVGVTLDNSAGAGGANPTYGAAVGVTTDATDWHLFSTPLMNAPLGIDYGTDGGTPYEFSFGHPDGMPYYRFYSETNSLHGYFPSMTYAYGSANNFVYNDDNTSATAGGSYYKEWDFYAYSEPNYHWVNFKRNSVSHHHYDTEEHEAFTYFNGDGNGNEKMLVKGKGYFVATREETMLQCHDTLNNGAVETTYNLTQTAGVPRHGYNLLGNPYQAYLDFKAFAEANHDTEGDDDEAIWKAGDTPSYTILDEDEGGYVTYAYDASWNPGAAGCYIHPHQGFFVRMSDDRTESTAYFYGTMRDVTATGTKFREAGHVDYPLVNLYTRQSSNGGRDMVTVELGRPDKGGAPLMRELRVGDGKLWCSYEGRDYAIAFTQPGVSEAAIRFETEAEAEYTMTWDTHNGEFGYLHLIDNKTGADIDCLTTGEYKFTASPSDYTSRFRLVFDYTGVEESEGDTPTGPATFAFMMGDELVVTGEGVLQAFDVTGRMVLSRELRGVQTTVPLPEASSGVYVLRLTNGRESQVQKMVISK